MLLIKVRPFLGVVDVGPQQLELCSGLAGTLQLHLHLAGRAGQHLQEDERMLKMTIFDEFSLPREPQTKGTCMSYTSLFPS